MLHIDIDYTTPTRANSLLTPCVFVFVPFFFQAEDGIRDTSVTGVQTCALPISAAPGADTVPASTEPTASTRSARAIGLVRRSEERRVGKECRSRGSADNVKTRRVECEVYGAVGQQEDTTQQRDVYKVASHAYHA